MTEVGEPYEPPKCQHCKVLPRAYAYGSMGPSSLCYGCQQKRPEVDQRLRDAEQAIDAIISDPANGVPVLTEATEAKIKIIVLRARIELARKLEDA